MLSFPCDTFITPSPILLRSWLLTLQSLFSFPVIPSVTDLWALEGRGERGSCLTDHQQVAEHMYSYVVRSTLSHMRKLRPGDMQSSARGYTCGEEGEDPFASPLSLCMMSQSPLQKFLDHDIVCIFSRPVINFLAPRRSSWQGAWE